LVVQIWEEVQRIAMLLQIPRQFGLVFQLYSNFEFEKNI